MATDATVLLIGGRSGVGKTSVAFETSELLQASPHGVVPARLAAAIGTERPRRGGGDGPRA